VCLRVLALLVGVCRYTFGGVNESTHQVKPFASIKRKNKNSATTQVVFYFFGIFVLFLLICAHSIRLSRVCVNDDRSGVGVGGCCLWIGGLVD